MSEGIFGIDISRHKENFDFAKAKAEGVKFIIIKAGGGDDGLYKDSAFERNYAEAKKNGMPIGAYWFSDAHTVNEAKKEAQYFVGLLKGKKFEYPIYMDVEQRMKQQAPTVNDAIIKAFCNTVADAGYYAGFYCDSGFYKYNCSGAVLAEKYSLWLASWGTARPYNCPIWQFGGETNLLRSNIVAGQVIDQDYAYKDFPTEIKAKGLNGYTKESPKPVTPPAKPVAPKPTVAKPTNTGIITYRAYAKGKWWGEIKSTLGTGTNAYAGVIGAPLSGLKAKAEHGKIYIQTHIKGGSWLAKISSDKYAANTSDGYSGIYDKPIDMVKIWSDYGHVDFRVHIKGGGWLDWIDSRNCNGTGYDSYAGITGKEIDAIQMQ